MAFQFLGGFIILSLFLCLSAFFQLKKLQKTIDIRFQNSSQHGLNTKTYGNKISLRLNQYFHMLATGTTYRFMILAFQRNFGVFSCDFWACLFISIFMFYVVFQKILYKHLKVLSLAEKRTSKEQESYVYEQLGNTYIFSVCFGALIAIFASNQWVVSFLVTPVLVIQIINNCLGNYKKGVNLSYALTAQAYVLYLPFYSATVKQNIFFTRPNYTFICVNVAIIFIFVIVLQIQRKWPRFFMPASLITKMCETEKEDFIWSQNFDSLSTRSSSSPRSTLSPRSTSSHLSSLLDGGEIPIVTLKERECSICLTGLGRNPTNTEEALQEFFKTPCGHKFHKQCILQWMSDRHQCPLCRSTLPIYMEDEEI